jgi:hypothetical protein
MGFAPNGVYSPAAGALSAAPGQVIRSATWNSIFTDLATLGLTPLGKVTWSTNQPRTVASGSFTVLTTDVAVFVSGSSPSIYLPAASLVTSPFAILGASGTVFGSANAKVIASGADTLSGVGTLTLSTNYMVAYFYPVGGGYVVTYGQDSFSTTIPSPLVVNTIISNAGNPLLLESPSGQAIQFAPVGGAALITVNGIGLLPINDNTQNLGFIGNRWSNVYGTTLTGNNALVTVQGTISAAASGVVWITGNVTVGANNAATFRMDPTISGDAGGAGNAMSSASYAPTFTPTANIANAYGILYNSNYNPGANVTIATASVLGLNFITRTTGTITTGNAISIVSAYSAMKPVTARGVYVGNMGGSGVTTSYGLYVDAQSGSATNFGIVSNGNILSVAPTGGVGYGTGAGGTVVQATSKATAVTLAASCGQITMSGATLAASTIVSFSLTNSVIAATDVLVLNHISGGTPGSYGLNAQAAAGSATINVRNNTAGALAEAIVLQYALVKAVNS